MVDRVAMMREKRVLYGTGRVWGSRAASSLAHHQVLLVILAISNCSFSHSRCHLSSDGYASSSSPSSAPQIARRSSSLRLCLMYIDECRMSGSATSCVTIILAQSANEACDVEHSIVCSCRRRACLLCRAQHHSSVSGMGMSSQKSSSISAMSTRTTLASLSIQSVPVYINNELHVCSRHVVSLECVSRDRTTASTFLILGAVQVLWLTHIPCHWTLETKATRNASLCLNGCRSGLELQQRRFQSVALQH